MKFDLKMYVGNFGIHCKTHDEAVKFCSFLDAHNLRWCTGKSYVKKESSMDDPTFWDVHKEDTIYFFNEGTYGTSDAVEGYTILEWSDFSWESNLKRPVKMTLQEISQKLGYDVIIVDSH